MSRYSQNTKRNSINLYFQWFNTDFMNPRMLRNSLVIANIGAAMLHSFDTGPLVFLHDSNNVMFIFNDIETSFCNSDGSKFVFNDI